MSTLAQLTTDTIDALDLRPCPKVTPTMTVAQANAAMREARVGAVIVVDDAGMPMGMYNEKLLIRLLADRPNAMHDPVTRHMTRHVRTVRRGTSIGELLETMRRRNLRWVCVVDDDGRPIALTGLRGLIAYVVETYLPEVAKVHPIERRLAMAYREGA